MLDSEFDKDFIRSGTNYITYLNNDCVKQTYRKYSEECVSSVAMTQKITRKMENTKSRNKE